MYPEILRIGSLVIQSYGFMLALGFLAVFFVVKAEFKRMGENPQSADPLVMSAIIGGIIGARVYYILEQWDTFVEYPVEIIFSRGGLVWYGGFALGTLAVVLMARVKKLRLGMVANSAAPAIALAYAITRIGCFLNGCCYGTVTSLPWGMRFPNNPLCQSGNTIHPTQLYESGASFIIFAIIWSIRRRPLPGWSLFFIYLVLGSLERFLVEFVRATEKIALGLSMAQILSIGIIVFSLIGLIVIFRRVGMRQA
jgi:phosphatidylglycerol:prolipoprotein diacylglycerol transferase